MEIIGKIIDIGSTQVISSNFKKRDFVLEYKDKGKEEYVQHLPFELIQHRCDYIDNTMLNTFVKLVYVLRGYRYKRKDGTFKNYLSLRVLEVEPTTVL